MQLMTSNNKTMNSEELAILLNMRHDNVRQAAINLQSHGVISFTEISVKGQGRPKQVLQFNERNSIIIAAKLNNKFLAAVIDRWKELETKQVETPEQLLARAVISAQAVIDEKNQLLEQARPAIELHESIVNDEGTLSMRDAGKQLQVKPNKLIEWLRESKYLNSSNHAYQSKIDAGYMRLSTTEYNGKPRTKTRVTGKGFAHLGKKIAEVRFANPGHNMFYKS
jgi:phage antirepressor YoqD-like protein